MEQWLLQWITDQPKSALPVLGILLWVSSKALEHVFKHLRDRLKVQAAAAQREADREQWEAEQASQREQRHETRDIETTDRLVQFYQDAYNTQLQIATDLQDRLVKTNDENVRLATRDASHAQVINAMSEEIERLKRTNRGCLKDRQRVYKLLLEARRELGQDLVELATLDDIKE